MTFREIRDVEEAELIYQIIVVLNLPPTFISEGYFRYARLMYCEVRVVASEIRELDLRTRSDYFLHEKGPLLHG